MSERRLAELAALAAAISVWTYVGWDGAMWDARLQLALHLAAAGAVAGLALLAIRGGSLPWSPIVLPIGLLLLAFGAATLTAWNAGVSARALAGALGTALMLPVALVALRHRPAWTGLVVTVPIIGLGLISLAALAGRRLEWVLVGGPGLPPVRLGHEATPFGSVAVPPFILLAALPLALLIPDRRLRPAVLTALGAVGLPLTLLSGSRSAWIAIGVAAVVLLASGVAGRIGRPRLLRRWTATRLAVALGLLGVGGLALAFIAPRLTDIGSLVYRGFLWRDTLAAWSTDPLLGIGPGSMPWARQAAAPPLTFPVRQPHSHDVPLGILGDAGLLGLAAAAVLAVAFVRLAGPWRQRSFVGRAAFAVLAGLAAGMLFEDLTFLPNFNLLVVLLAALALAEAGAVSWRPVRPRAWQWAAMGLAATALMTITLVGDSAAVAYRFGMEAAAAGRWEASRAWLERAVALDPWQPTGPKSLTVAAERAGDPALARAAAERAVALSPGDGPSWTNLAVLCREEEDRSCAARAAARAVEKATAPGRELVNAAVVYDWLGRTAEADGAYRLSLLTNYWTGLLHPWHRPIEPGRQLAPEIAVETAELNLLVARRLHGEPIEPAAYATPFAQMLANAMVGDRDAALEAVDEAIATRPASATTWEMAALLRRHYGRDVSHELAVGEVARGEPLPTGPSREAALIFDIATFRAYPANGLVSSAERLLADTPWPWVLEPLLE